MCRRPERTNVSEAFTCCCAMFFAPRLWWRSARGFVTTKRVFARKENAPANEISKKQKQKNGFSEHFDVMKKFRTTFRG